MFLLHNNFTFHWSNGTNLRTTVSVALNISFFINHTEYFSVFIVHKQPSSVLNICKVVFCSLFPQTNWHQTEKHTEPQWNFVGYCKVCNRSRTQQSEKPEGDELPHFSSWTCDNGLSLSPHRQLHSKLFQSNVLVKWHNINNEYVTDFYVTIHNL